MQGEKQLKEYHEYTAKWRLGEVAKKSRVEPASKKKSRGDPNLEGSHKQKADERKPNAGEERLKQSREQTEAAEAAAYTIQLAAEIKACTNGRKKAVLEGKLRRHTDAVEARERALEDRAARRKRPHSEVSGQGTTTQLPLGNQLDDNSSLVTQPALHLSK